MIMTRLPAGDALRPADGLLCALHGNRRFDRRIGVKRISRIGRVIRGVGDYRVSRFGVDRAVALLAKIPEGIDFVSGNSAAYRHSIKIQRIDAEPACFWTV